ncbi:hypothetical protein HMPREF0494_1120 [Limosilactobacillus antri DSM 16041]|uniref:Uncharacterized protein n=1 Tax=Limosilactobacillus antri DSM 16041 TaxID=525309 RepID=C8P726_9LACO|nr:hypothetical protein HMPREF0494_1120 [Limosilactobacillus antri DSM 16041]
MLYLNKVNICIIPAFHNNDTVKQADLKNFAGPLITQGRQQSF